jgi:hypothetical protein
VMPIKMKRNDFEQIEPGTYAARLTDIVDLGTQNVIFNGEHKTAHKILGSFVTPGELRTDGRPFKVFRTFTASLHRKSALRRDLEAWLGRPISKEEEASFDLPSLLGKPVLVSIAETENGRRKVTSLAPIPRGMDMPPAQTPGLYFSLDPMEFSEETLAQVPEYWRELIKSSPEYKLIKDGQDYLHGPAKAAPVDDDDDIPWD